MPRRARFDTPGCLHHVMNRGIARRTIFESRTDARYFLALLARSCWRGKIELHAYTLMSTHFHLVLRSVDGRLSETMRWVLNRYVRYFNRTRRRDGPLMRGRFRSIPIHSLVYLRTLFRYVDQNAVDAGLVARPGDYAYGSACHLRSRGCKPRWLERSLVDLLLLRHGRTEQCWTANYDMVFAPKLTRHQKSWIDARLRGQARAFDELDTLLGGSAAIVAWAKRKARLADGTQPGIAVVDPETAEHVMRDSDRVLGEFVARPQSGRRRPAVDLMRVALLRDAVGLPFVAIAARIGVSAGTPQKLYRLHGECVDDPAYRDAYAAIVLRALRHLHES